MAWQTTGDVTKFLAMAGDFLRAERARNTVILTVTETMRANPARYRAAGETDPARLPLAGWWTDDENAVAGAFLQTPPFPVLLTTVPAPAAADLAADLAGRPVGGVNSAPETAHAFAAAWRERTGEPATVHRRLRLYRLARLAWRDPLPGGAPRLANDADVPLLAEWFTAFEREVGDMGANTDQTVAVKEKLGYHGVTVWDDLTGQPVSIAGLTRQVAGMVRVGPVYTPPALRGRGYASAVTAAVSQAALDRGAQEVLLYTDLANPVSNSIYQRIGYRPVEDRVVLAFANK